MQNRVLLASACISIALAGCGGGDSAENPASSATGTDLESMVAYGPREPACFIYKPGMPDERMVCEGEEYPVMTDEGMMVMETFDGHTFPGDPYLIVECPAEQVVMQIDPRERGGTVTKTPMLITQESSKPKVTAGSRSTTGRVLTPGLRNFDTYTSRRTNGGTTLVADASGGPADGRTDRDGQGGDKGKGKGSGTDSDGDGIPDDVDDDKDNDGVPDDSDPDGGTGSSGGSNGGSTSGSNGGGGFIGGGGSGGSTSGSNGGGGFIGGGGSGGGNGGSNGGSNGGNSGGSSGGGGSFGGSGRSGSGSVIGSRERCPRNRSIVGSVFADDEMTLGQTGWTFPGLINGDCPLTAAVLKINDSGGPFGSMNF